MNIVTIGTGYVGLVTATCLAELGNTVIGVDIDQVKINKLNEESELPIYEPGLEELVRRNQKEGRLYFTTSIKDALKEAEVIFIAVGTPSMPNGEADLSYVEQAAKDIAQHLQGYAVIVNKSTVPIGTGNLVHRIVADYYKGDFDVVSNPEFLREGSAVEDFMKPDRVVIGNGSKTAEETMKKLYEPLDCPIITTNLETAEMIKYAANSLLATNISFINSVASICEKVGADVTKVSEGMRYDKRIGKHAFLNAGIGYGGSCFPKDVKALISIAERYHVPFNILEHVEQVNEQQKEIAIEKLSQHLKPIMGKAIAIWGLAFKPQTDDMREAPALTLINKLREHGANIQAFDPVAQEQAEKIIGDSQITYAETPYEAIKNADALIIATEWNAFRQLDLETIKGKMKQPIVIDGRNVYDPKEMHEAGFIYESIGRPHNQ